EAGERTRRSERGRIERHERTDLGESESKRMIADEDVRARLGKILQALDRRAMQKAQKWPHEPREEVDHARRKHARVAQRRARNPPPRTHVASLPVWSAP